MSSANLVDLQIAANSLTYIGMVFVQCYCYVAMPLGAIGHVFSIYVFTRPSLRSNPCSRYLLAATAFGILVTLYTLPMRLIQSGLVNADPGAYSDVFCKITWFILYSIRFSTLSTCSLISFLFSLRRGLAFWLIVLACADRYLCSCESMRSRSWSSVQVANRVIPLFILIGFVAYLHVPVFFQVNIIPATQKPICYPPGPPGTYRIVLSYFNLIFFGLFPPFLMLLFGVLTLRNIIRSKQRIIPRDTVENIRKANVQKSNRQMIRVLFAQVLVYSVTGLAFSVASIIAAMSAAQSKTVFQLAQDGLVNAIVGMMSNTGPCFSFYLFTLSSSLFRKELKNLFQKIRHNGIHRQQTQTQGINTERVRTVTGH